MGARGLGSDEGHRGPGIRCPLHGVWIEPGSKAEPAQPWSRGLSPRAGSATNGR